MYKSLSYWLSESIKQERFEEISDIAFDWELFHIEEYYAGGMVPLFHSSDGSDHGMDESEGMFYGADYFINRDYVH